MLIASLWHNIALYQGNNLPLPGTKRYVGSFFIKAPLFFLLFTLHQIGWNPDKHWGCEWWRVTHHSSPLFTWIFYSSDYAELTEHSGSTDYARILNGWSTCSVYEMTQIFRVKSGEEWRATLHPRKFLSYRYLHLSGEEWRVFLKLYGQSFSGKVLEIRR